jgi:hypothetical protein
MKMKLYNLGLCLAGRMCLMTMDLKPSNGLRSIFLLHPDKLYAHAS